MRFPHVLVMADVPGWAWDRKGQAYQRYLSDRFEITLAYASQGYPHDLDAYDLVHLFEVSQIGLLSSRPRSARRFRAIAGLTAHVWRTWGEDRMRHWAAQVDALHGNSRLIEAELRQFHPRVYYTPNGVDVDFWRRFMPRQEKRDVVFGHVGKPNPRKGGALLVEAARKAGAELRLVQRTAKVAYTAHQMRGWYQNIDVMAAASNMDGTPNPMLEGASCECALLSTPIGNMPEFIKPGWGFLTVAALPYHGPGIVDDPDVLAADARARDALRDELAERMRWFQDHRAETTAMGLAARAAAVADWQWERQVEHVATMWREVLG